MYQFFYRVLLAHPADINETYFQHLVAACGFAARLFFASVACFIHALIPCLFERTASESLNRLYGDLYQNRSSRPDPEG
jgi:hypothetical protein